MAMIEETFILKDRVTETLENIAGAAISLSNKFSDAIEAMRPLQEPFVPSMQGEIKDIANAFEDIGDRISRFREDAGGLTLSEAQEGAQALLVEINNNAKALEDLRIELEGVGGDISLDEFQSLQQTINDVGNDAKLFREEITNIGIPMQNISQEIENTRTKWNSVNDIIGNVGSGVKSVYEKVKDVAGAIINRIMPATKIAESGIKGWQMAIITANQALELAQNLWGRISGTIKGAIAYSQGIFVESVKTQRAIFGIVGNLEDTRIEYEKITALASDLGKQIGISNTDLEYAAGTIARYTKDIDGAANAMEAVADIAMALSKNFQVSGQDISSIADQLGRAASTGRLMGATIQRLNLSDVEREMFKVSNEVERMNILVNAAEREFGGFSRAVANTPIGMINKMNIEIDNIRQVLGDAALMVKGQFAAAFLYVLPTIQSAITSASVFIEKNIETIKTAFILLGAVALAVGIKMMIPFIKPLVVIGLLAAALWGISQKLQEMGYTAADILGFVGGLFFGLVEVVKSVAMSIWEAIKSAIDAIKDNFSGLFSSTEDGFADNAEKIAAIFANVLDFIIAWGDKLLLPIRMIANFIGNVFKNPISSVIKLFEDLGKTVINILAPVASLLDKILKTNTSAAIDKMRAGLTAASENLISRFAPDEDYNSIIPHLADILSGEKLVTNFREGFEKGQERSIAAMESLTDVFGDMKDSMSLDALAGGGMWKDSPFTFNPDGSLKTANQNDISIRGENLRFLVDIATRRYAQQYRQQSAPVNVNFPNMTIRETADSDIIIDKLVRGMQQGISSNAAYAGA